jgi:hypothetical protein
MCKTKLDIQTGNRVMERLVIQRAYDYVKTDEKRPPRSTATANPVVNASKATYYFSPDGEADHGNVRADFEWQREKHAGLQPILQEHITRLLVTTLFADYATEATANGTHGLQIPFFTEYERNGFGYQARSPQL